MKKLKFSKIKIALLSLFICLSAILSAATAAYLINRQAIKNTFTPASVDCEVNETFDKMTKSNVTIKNTGTASAYIRAIVVANWVNDEGKIYYQAPKAGTDYSIIYGSDWKKHEEYYYYSNEVDANNETGVLIDSCTVLNAAPMDGYHLEVEIVAEAIQSEGTDSNGQTPASLAWGYDPVNGN